MSAPAAADAPLGEGGDAVVAGVGEGHEGKLFRGLVHAAFDNACAFYAF